MLCSARSLIRLLCRFLGRLRHSLWGPIISLSWISSSLSVESYDHIYIYYVNLYLVNTVKEFLMAFNKIHSLNRIQNVYKSIYTKLTDWKLVDEQLIYAEHVKEAFH